MSWANFGNGPGVYRSGPNNADTVQLGAIPDIVEDLRIGVNERIAITDLADVAAFETGEGMTYAQTKAAVAALKSKIEALIATGYCAGAWPPVSFFSTIADVLTLGSYGDSWLTFERLQDGRVYEQIREVLDCVLCVGANINSVAQIDRYEGRGWVNPADWAAAYAEAAPNTWRTLGGLYTSLWNCFWTDAHYGGWNGPPETCVRIGTFRFHDAGWNIQPEGFAIPYASFVVTYGGPPGDWSFTFSIDGASATCAYGLSGYVYVEGDRTDDYTEVLIDDGSLDALNPATGVECSVRGDAGDLLGFDRGVTWTKKS